MFILGLTGSIAMGKSWAAKCLRLQGVPVFDADAYVHALTAPGGGAVDAVDAGFPGFLNAKGGVDRQRLGAQVLGDDAALARLEAILHPRVRAAERAFLARHRRWGSALVALDIPLLFETDARALVDAVAVVSAPEFLQRQRALRRPGMTVQKFQAVLARQTPDADKRRRADFVIQTGGPRGQSLRRIRDIVKVTRKCSGRAWGPDWGRALRA